MKYPLWVLKGYQTIIYTAVAVIIVVLVIVSFGSLESEQSQAISTNSCPTTYSVTLSNGPTTGVTSGMVNVGLNTTPPSGTTSVTISRVIFYLDSSRILGRGVMSTTSQNFWSMLWQSPVTANGQYNIKAEVLHSNGFVCTVMNGPTTTVQNATRTPIPIQTILPSSWSGPTNLPTDFQLTSGTTSPTDVRQFMQVEWSTNIGSITPGSPNFLGRFFSGPSGGNGAVKARIFYGGEVKEIQAPVTITSYNNQTTTTINSTPVDSNDGPISNSDSDETSDSTDDSGNTVDSDDKDTPVNTVIGPTLTSQVLSSDGPVRNCLLSSIGEERLKLIEDEKSRPTAAEFEKYRTCFARQSFVVAQSLAPVAPEKVRELPKSNEVAFKKAETVTTEVDGKNIDSIVFRGNARPNTTVLIYIFSEPLVLTTASNDSGEWTYTLEDPLESGSHEAYTVVDKGNGEYERSDLFSFVVARAEASEANPNGFSLQLATTATAQTDDRSRNIFIVGAVTLVLLTVGGLMLILKIRNSHKKTLQINSNNDSTEYQTPFMRL